MTKEEIIVKFLSDRNSATSREICNFMLSEYGIEISQSSFSRIMQALESSGEITKEGDRKSARYSVDDYRSFFSRPYYLRPKAPYDISYIENIDPSKSCMTEKELDQLLEIGTPNSVELSTLSLSAYSQFILDLSYSSSKMEGNLYTYIDTEVLLKYGEYAKDKPDVDGLMILNHKHALDYIIENISQVDIDLQTIRDVHAILSNGMPGVQPDEQGACRKRIVSMNGSAFEPLSDPHQIPAELDRLIQKCSSFISPFDQAVYLLGLIPYLQPFVDVNKRTGRLMCNIPLIKAGLAPFSFRDMDKHKYTVGMLALYELRDIKPLKSAFIDAYLKSAPYMVDILNMAQQNSINPIQVKYRKEIKSLVRMIVCNEENVDIQQVLLADFDIDPRDINELEALIKKTVDSMHEGLLAVYGISKKDLEKHLEKSNSTIKPSFF